jgi:hypothetical protein
MGKLTPAQGNYTFAIVTVEYFTKWVEAKPVTNITSATIQKFFWQNIICHYEVPQQITVDMPSISIVQYSRISIIKSG